MQRNRYLSSNSISRAQEAWANILEVCQIPRIHLTIPVHNGPQLEV